ncbi:AraC family ligand binding domain-containing protein, partial [bacterium]|nr:AraC family ligand binding domain-containing protein [bacterium]
MHSRKSILDSIHWTTGEEMLFTSDQKYRLALPPDFPLLIKFYLFTSAYPIIPNYHDFYEIGCCYSGRGKYFISDKTFNIRAGSILFIQANQMHYVEADRDDPLKSASIYFMPELLFHPGSNPYDSHYLLPFHSLDKRGNPHMREADLDFSLWELILDMHRELQSKESYYQLALKNRLCEALLRILKR